VILRAVKLEVLVLDDVHISASEVAEAVAEALEIHVEARRVEVEVLEDHEVYTEDDGGPVRAEA
jgi:nicotinate-nucleotide pyrophosphorylase